MRLSMNGWISAPLASVARHIRPSVTPATHIEATYSSRPPTCSQKCSSMAAREYMAGRPSARGAMAYSEPMVIIATQPMEPECTCATVQSVLCDNEFKDLIESIEPSNVDAA